MTTTPTKHVATVRLNSEPQLLLGFKDISNFLGITERRVRWLVKKNSIPTFRIDSTLAARPCTLRDWLSEMEKRGRSESRT